MPGFILNQQNFVITCPIVYITSPQFLHHHEAQDNRRMPNMYNDTKNICRL